MNTGYKLLTIILLMLLAGTVSAVPITGATSGLNSNGFNVSVTGITGTDAWIEWGDYSGKLNWVTPNATASGGAATISVIGAPIYGGEHIVYRVCDLTGCDDEESINIPAVTPMPTATFRQLVRNITNSRFSPLVITVTLLSAYTTVTPQSVLFGIMGLFFAIGIWMRTKSVRLMAVLAIVLSPLIMFASTGLGLGMPVIATGLSVGLMAAGLAGILLSFMRR